MILSRKRLLETAALVAPSPRLRISKWADKHAWIPPEGNAEPGKYRLARMPHQAAMLDDPNEPGVREVFWMMASQASGKTLCIIILCEFVIAELRKSIIMVRATASTALEWMREKFLPTVRETPKVKDLLKNPRQRDSESTSLNRKFPGGSLKAVGAKSPAAFRGTSAPVIFQDEVDSYISIKEGDPCALADRAAITFADAWKLKCSTPTLKDYSKIDEGYQRGDKQKYFLPCPVCGHFQDLKFERVKFTFSADEAMRLDLEPSKCKWEIGNFPIRRTDKALYVCEKCEHGWSDRQRLQSYWSGHKDNPPVIVNGKELRAEWRATAPFTGIRSRHLSGMYLSIGLKAGMASYLQQFAEDFLEAKRGGRETMMVWWNIFRSEPFEDAHEKLDWKTIHDRAEDYIIPAQVCWIAFGMDVQQDRIEILFYGWGDGQEAWCLDHHVIYGDFDMPTMQERVWDYLSNKKFEHPVLGEMPWKAGVIDSGKQTDLQAVYQFCARHQVSNVFSCKGFDDALGSVYSRATERVYGGTRFNFNTDYLKCLIFDRLKNVETGPRYIHFRKNEGKFFQQLCSERRVPIKQPKGGYKWQWQKHSSATRNEILDMTVYAFGIFEVSREQEWIARKWSEVKIKLRETNPPKSVQYTGFNFDEIEAFVGGDYGKNKHGDSVVATPQGALKICPNDTIVKDSDGRFYVKGAVTTPSALKQPSEVKQPAYRQKKRIRINSPFARRY
jgi:phage terminase large subunit GpA-like protein